MFQKIIDKLSPRKKTSGEVEGEEIKPIKKQLTD